MSFYRISKQIYRKFRHHINTKKNDVEVDQYLKEFKEKFGDILGEKTLHVDEKVLLIHSSHNLSYCMNIESILAKKIQLEYGWKVVFLCTLSTVNLAKKICQNIYGFTNFVLIEDYTPVFGMKGKGRLMSIVENAKTLKEIKDIKYKNIPVGVHALASYSGAIPSANIVLNSKSRSILKKIIKNIIRQSITAKNIINSVNPNLVLSIEKGSVGTCEMFYESINNDIDYVQYASCHQPNSIMLKRYNKKNQRMHPFSISDKSWINSQYKEFMAKEVKKSFEDGYRKGEWFKYKNLSNDKKIICKDDLTQALDLNVDKKNVIIFSHILNDANFYYGSDLFEGGFKEWFVKTIEAAIDNDKVNWLVKLHPANIFRRKNQNYTGEYGEILAIKEYFGCIPDNIKIIPADIDINPYSFFMLADYGVTVRGTVGAELPCFGIPVLTAGTGRYSNKGFTVDSNTSEEYLEKIKNIHLIDALTKEQIEIANKHAYLFFKQRPAKYHEFIKDSFHDTDNIIIARDVEIVDKDIWRNETLGGIANFLTQTSDEDYLMDIHL